MGTVLCNQSMRDLDEHFLNHGTRLPFIRGNNDATKSWIEVLRKKADTTDDMQPLNLVNEMTEIQSINRPTAPQFVNAVSNFDGDQPYHGICCSGDWDDGQSLGEEDVDDYATMVEDVPPDTKGCADLVTDDEELGTIKMVDRKSAIDDTQSLKALEEVHPGPACQDPKTIHFPGSERPLHALQAYVEDCVTEVVPQKPDQVPEASMGKESKIWTKKADSVLDTPSREVLSSTQISATTDKPQSIDMTRLTCQWPNCGGQKTDSAIFVGRSALQEHYRSAHQVHEFSYSLSLGDSQTPRASDPTLDHRSNMQIPEDGSAQEWRYTFAQEKLPVRVTFDLGENGTNGERSYTGHEHKKPSPFQQETDKAMPRLKASNKGPGHSASREDGPARFSLLPSGRRSEPISVVEKVTVEPGVYCFVNPERLNSPGMPANPVSGQARDGQYQLPKSSLAPSYILASTSQFAKPEVAGFMPNRRLTAFSQRPLFVYGSFMFPSILRRQAETFVSSGVYSASDQRRLRSDATDWARVNVSLQHAAEEMTPALLSGYDRWKPVGLSCASIVESTSTPRLMGQIERRTALGFVDSPKGEVQGFLVFGLAEEALKCCDMLFSRNSLESLYTDDGWASADSFKLPENSEPFQRKTVNVRFSLKGGEVRSIDATTYVWKAPYATIQCPWNINRFVKSKSFCKLSGALSSSLWMSEERKLAKTMGITFVLPGDALGDAVLCNDMKHVTRLLREGDDVNAPCQGYGSVLQAASAQGSEEIVSLLLRRGAMVNASGGQYESALLAATVRGHEGVVKILVKASADILKDGGVYVSPIYQAVSHSDVDMVLLLLEHGAWLTRNYGELVDLASEKGNDEIWNLLDEYDMRDLRQKLPSSNRKANRWDSDEDSEGNLNDDRSRRINRSSGKDQVAMRPAKVLRAVVCKALLLKGTRGKWTGIKSVKVLRTAIKAGLSPQILEDIRPNLSSIQKLLDFLKSAVLNYAGEQNPSSRQKRPGIAPKYPMGTVTELNETSDSDGDPMEGRSRGQRTSYRQPSFTTHPHVVVSVE
jgi:Ankyrin repeats (3 copies)